MNRGDRGAGAGKPEHSEEDGAAAATGGAESERAGKETDERPEETVYRRYES
jgi:hypothetical protein